MRRVLTAFRNSCGLLILGCLLLLGTRAIAQTEPGLAKGIPPRRDAMRVSLEILVNGRPLPTVRHEGKTFLPVPRIGQEYTIRIRNHGPRRVAAILSVDGLSSIDGRPASEKSRGHVLGPRSSVVIKGWRRDLDTVAAFRFVSRGESYANLVGSPDNVGVIGLIAIEEKVTEPKQVGLPMKDTGKDVAGKGKGGAGKDKGGMAKGKGKAAKGGAANRVGGTGTGYGRELDSAVTYVAFNRGTNRRTLTYYYDAADTLRQLGVPVDRPAPNPFPGGVSPFSPPPPGYRGR